MSELELARNCIPWTPLRKPLAEARVCLVSSAGVRLRSDPPFDPEGDLSYRTIDGAATAAQLTYDDAHYDHACVDADLNCVFPVDRLRELAEAGHVRAAAERHFAYGFSMKLKQLRDETFPPLVREVEKVRPDVVLLTGG